VVEPGVSPPVGLNAAAVLSLQKNWGAVAMMLLEYRLECGCAQTVRVPVDQVEPEQITGTEPASPGR